MIDQGKGDKWRKRVNYKKYWENFSELETNHISHAKVVSKKGSKTRYIYHYLKPAQN